MAQAHHHRDDQELLDQELLGQDLLDQDLLRLDLQLCFALHAASRSFVGFYRHALRETGLTYPQYLVMLVLWEHGELTVKELGAHLRLDSGTLSPLLKRLESAGLLRRERSAEDERSVTVGLTAAGDELRFTAREVPVKAMTASGLNAPDGARLREQLLELAASLDRANY